MSSLNFAEKSKLAKKITINLMTQKISLYSLMTGDEKQPYELKTVARLVG